MEFQEQTKTKQRKDLFRETLPTQSNIKSTYIFVTICKLYKKKIAKDFQQRIKIVNFYEKEQKLKHKTNNESTC